MTPEAETNMQRAIISADNKIIALENNAVQDRKAVTSQVKQSEERTIAKLLVFKADIKAHRDWLLLVDKAIKELREGGKRTFFSWFK